MRPENRRLIGMPSRSLHLWRTTRSAALDEIRHAHDEVEGTGRGRRYATQQLNQAYAVLLASQFQGYCRDLHTECMGHLTVTGASPTIRAVIGTGFIAGRRLDSGNAHAASLSDDFARFGIAVLKELKTHRRNNRGRLKRLESLNTWRNAIAHQDFDPVKLGRKTLLLRMVTQWRTACDGLAKSLDEIMRIHLQSLAGITPW